MEEEVGIKVTRLRRRLSVETEDVKSPSTQSTPTKKRGGRLAAKPQLELIDENATEVEKPKRTRKSTAKDVEHEENPVTPARRSTRIRSNTSIVSETPAEGEDKGTPSRRRTRIKSNTSIVAETVPFTDSPRAKRAARRTSQVGSDNEAPVTPARQTRRTRKDSTSSIDKPVEINTGTSGTQVTEAIIEETETTSKETPTGKSNESPTVRKSPRLIRKTGRQSSSLDNDDKENEPKSAVFKNEEKSNNVDDVVISTSTKVDQNNELTEENNLSVSSSNLIKELDGEPKKGKAILSKTTTEAELPQTKSNRHRRKSWTTISSSPKNETIFLSDTETIKKKNKRKSHELSNLVGSGDSVLNTSNKSVQGNKEQKDLEEITLNSSITSDKKKKKSRNKSLTLDTDTPKNESTNSVSKEDSHSSQKLEQSLTEKFFGVAPSGTIQALVYIEDSDSNTDSVEKVNVNKEFDNEDQCVPVVEHHLTDANVKETKNDLSYEPMDIDETIPGDVSLSVFTDKNASVRMEENVGLGKRKSVLNISQVSIDNIANKSHRKSTILDLENNDENTLNVSKNKSVIGTSNDITNKSMNKSKRKSTVVTIDGAADMDDDSNLSKNQSTVEEPLNKSLNKSKKRFSVLNNVSDDETYNNSSNATDKDDNINERSNHAKNTSFVTHVDQDSNAVEAIINVTNESKRKSSISRIDVDDDLGIASTIAADEHDDVIDKSSSKSKRKSSISNMKDKDNMDISINKSLNSDNMNKSSNKSKRKSSISNADNNDSAVKDANKPERKSSVSNIVDNDEVDSSSYKSKLAISIENIDDGIINNSTYKSNRKSTLSDDNAENIISQIESTIIDNDNDESMSKNSKQKRKSSIAPINIDDNIDKSSNKSKRKSSISHMESQTFDKSSNENKSTLVLSQIKDTSETNVPKDIYEFNDSNEQLSKSVNVPNVNKDKESDKKNLSLTYSTSTPLQQKSMKKLGMQINTSIIAPNSVTKIDKKGSFNRSKKETSVLSQNNEESEPSEEDEDDSEDEEGSEAEEEDSEEENEIISKSKMIDDEAEEASDDYESGDSRDDSEREYEERNEIKEKGETLDSEDEEFSDDSSYEKGSFIVDSDVEDNELLSGSGDDLSLDAEELSMSAKSKKKFNERKIKEQKKASREMFEARHKLNEYDKSSKPDKHKPKKSNRQRLESSDSESDEEVGVQPKKNRRARIDSSQDVSVPQSDTDKSISKKKKKVKRLSKSVCEDNATNENEISVSENKDTESVDPLSLQNAVKEEPKTPQKDPNISTVAITSIEEVEEVQVDENVSIMKLNQTSDPLQTTVADDESMEDDSDKSISENEEITQNYESVLNDLNKKSKKVKTLDISLNLNKKTKQKANEPIVDELNLTQVKKSKKKKIESNENLEPKKIDKNTSLSNKIMEKVNKSIVIQDEGSSDSIDMKLLFNEDSTDGEVKSTAKEQNDALEIAADFIPLKRTEGKTNILEQSDVTSTTNNDSILNGSKSKKSKRKSSQSENFVTMTDEVNENLSFFIDTQGTHTDMNKSVTNISIKDSAKKNKQKNNMSSANVEETKVDEDSNDAPLEVSYHSEKNDKSKLDLNTTQTDGTKVNTTTSETPNQSGKKKKKNKKSLESSQVNVEEQLFNNTDNVAEKSINTSVLSITGSKKKNKKLSVSHVEEEKEKEPDPIIYVGSAKKQKNIMVLENSAAIKKIIIEDETHVINTLDKSKKRKRNPSSDPSFEEMIVKDNTVVSDSLKALNESILTANEKKKRKTSHNDVDINLGTKDAVSEMQQQAKDPDNATVKKSNKKNKTVHEQKPDEKNEGTKKKNKKRKERDDDDGDKLSKVIKQNSFDKVHVPRLPANIIKQLDDQPKTDIEPKAKIISTTSFKVEETKRRRNKPSNYLEQSVYLNDSTEEETKQYSLKKPKVLPFIPTASTSNFGFTTNFKVNVIPQETQFVAQSSDISNFKNDYLHKNRIKKLGTFEMYKRHRNIKISKF